MCYVKPVAGYKECAYSEWFMDSVIYLPFHYSVPDADFRNILERTIEAYQ